MTLIEETVNRLLERHEELLMLKLERPDARSPFINRQHRQKVEAAQAKVDQLKAGVIEAYEAVRAA